jgi:hypothetical protein
MNQATMDILTIIAAVIVGTLGAARVVRLVVADSFPPLVWARIKWDTITKDGGWALLLHCPWCFAPYVVAADMAWALLSDLGNAWWVANGISAASYVASWIVIHDED